MHNVEYFTYDENIKRDYVQKDLDYYVSCETHNEGGHGLDHPIRWLENFPVCGDREQAEKAIDQNDRGWYDQLAVKFLEPVRGFTDKKVEELRAKERATLDAYHAKDSVWAKGLKAEYVSCKNCGSKLRRKYIQTNYCSLCRKDLRPESTLKAVEAAKARWHKAQEATKAYIDKHAKKSVKWLVKIEYHT